MSGAVRVFCFLLICLTTIHGLTELFCQDPDTGEFHAVNKTWSSSTSCGNLTCRIRRKVSTDMDTHASVQVVTAVTAAPLENDNKANEELPKTEEHNRTLLQILKANSNQSDPDRYLTDSEIKTISELLHMIKKSDLEAVIEVYNLAQDIYKEIESAPEEQKEEIYNHLISQLKPDHLPKVSDARSSYWYDPQEQLGAKTDIQESASDAVMSKPIYPYYHTPHYYPIPTYQHTSYFNPTRPMPVPTAQPNYAYYRAPNPYCPYTRREYSTLLPYPFSAVNQHNQTSPYRAYWAYRPYEIQHYDPPQKEVIPETNNVVNVEDYSVDTKEQILHKTVKETEKPKPLSNSILPSWLTAPLSKIEEGEKLAPWQTAPLAEYVLDDVKANILENRDKILFPLKKRLKLEKVAKVLKLDELTRHKREIVDIVEPISIDNLDFEVYIEKITCDLDTEPGVFSVGNLSATFPECCPKRIS